MITTNKTRISTKANNYNKAHCLVTVQMSFKILNNVYESKDKRKRKPPCTSIMNLSNIESNDNK